MARSIAHWPAETPRTAFIVDDHPIFCEGLTQIINGESDLRVCGSAGTAAKAVAGIARLRPDIALVDISLPDKSGLELIKELRARDRALKLLVVSMHDAALYARRVMQLGADGYITKMADPSEIVRTVRRILEDHGRAGKESPAGGTKGRPRRRARQPIHPIRPPANFTDINLEILELFGRSWSEQEIAEELGLSEEAVAAAVEEMGQKLHLRSHNALLRYAVSWVGTGRT